MGISGRCGATKGTHEYGEHPDDDDAYNNTVHIMIKWYYLGEKKNCWKNDNIWQLTSDTYVLGFLRLASWRIWVERWDKVIELDSSHIQILLSEKL